MSKSIILFTANVQGGILQFTMRIYKTLIEEGHTVKICIPVEIKDCDVSHIPEQDLILYHKVRKIVNTAPYKELAARINAVMPDYVWYMDDSVICSNVGLYIAGNIRQLLTIHDAGTYHPTNAKSLRSVILHRYTTLINTLFCRRVFRFILLSKESFALFRSLRPKDAVRAEMMPLSAHLPDTDEVMPAELAELAGMGFFLFFGRIDKYKGIGRLLDAYGKVSDSTIPLVIAGNGRFTKEELEKINLCGNLTVVKRYIQDNEMKWLFDNASALLLPYIEATQSGVIPLAYFFKKPVFVSDVKGLTQFVHDGKTGFICRNIEEWIQKLKSFQVSDGISMRLDIEKYYLEHLDWNRNIRELLKKV